MDKMKKVLSTTGILLVVLVLWAADVAATGSTAVKDIVCPILRSIEWVLISVASALVVVMFIYGGLKYVFSADDPGGRKSGKNTCIHAVIGGIIVVVATSITGLLTFSQTCPP